MERSKLKFERSNTVIDAIIEYSLKQIRALISILHTNDLHNHIAISRFAKLKKLRGELGENGLLLDAGDAGGSGNITFKRAGEPILEEMSDAGYDAMTVGNRDFHVTSLGFRSKLFRARFPILCANLRLSKIDASETNYENLDDILRDRPSHPAIHVSLFYELSGGFKVLVFGLTVPMVTERMWERKLSDYIFDNPISVAARLLPTLKKRYQPDFVVALTHIGLSRDRILATEVPGIDLIVGGHSHDTLPEGERVGETLIVQAGSHGQFYGRVDINRDVLGKTGFEMNAGVFLL